MAKKKKAPFISEEVMARIKSFAWRAGGMAVVAGLAYVITKGSVFDVDPKVLINLMIMVIAGLVHGEITKYLNNQSEE